MSLGEGDGNPLQYSCLENSVDRGAWWAAVHGVTQSWTRLKQLSMHASIGEGNGNPLQCSCLENPRDRGAWWAAVYGVAQSWTRLTRLSSSSSSSSMSLDSKSGTLRQAELGNKSINIQASQVIYTISLRTYTSFSLSVIEQSHIHLDFFPLHSLHQRKQCFIQPALRYFLKKQDSKKDQPSNINTN